MTIDRQTHSALLRLPVAEGASFDSKDEAELPTCLPDTRVEILQHINKWAADPAGKPLFWLHGKAGTGKSTISRTVAGSFHRGGVLAGSFSFKRTEDRGKASKFFPTLASQLARKWPDLQPSLVKAIEEDSALFSKSYKEQFERLILDPLSSTAICSTRDVCFVIAIDALDECDPDNDVRTIIRLLGRARNHSLPFLRLFVTSRPELPIRQEFQSISEELRLDFDLHAIEGPTIRHDIGVFLKHEFAKIKEWYEQETTDDPLPPGWPEKEKLERIIRLATPLFIFAATLCRFVGDQMEDPRERLEAVLAGPRTAYQPSDLERTYLPIFERVTAGRGERETAKLTEEFLAILGSIVVLADPLSAQALSSLLRIPLRNLNAKLRWLHSILLVPKDARIPIRLHHLSFYDFLVDPDRRGRGPFCVEESEVHSRLANDCITLLGARLKIDICAFKYPGMRRVDAARDIIDASFPAELRYACLHWVYHLMRSGRSVEDGGNVLLFLETHLLHWLEACSWLARLSTAAAQLRGLRSIAKERTGHRAIAFLDDALRFMVHNRHIIEQAPLQVCYSALVFAPSASRIKRLFHSPSKEMFTSLPETSATWSAEMHRLEQDGMVSSVAVSATGRLIATASSDGAARIYDMHTGDEIRQLYVVKGDLKYGERHCVAFSPDGRYLASSWSNEVVRLWSVSTWDQIAELVLPTSAVSLSFDPNGGRVACGCGDGEIVLWDISACIRSVPLGPSDVQGKISVATDTQHGDDAASVDETKVYRTSQTVRVLKGHSVTGFDVAFSPNGRNIACRDDGSGIVLLWDVSSRKCCTDGIEEASGLGICSCMTFAPNAPILALGRTNGRITLWDLLRRQAISTLRGHEAEVSSVAISSDGELLVSGSRDRTVRIWNMTTGVQVFVHRGHQDWVTTVAFMPDGRSLVSGSFDTTVQIWDMSAPLFQDMVDEPDGIKVLTFSDDGHLLASGSKSGIVKLWGGVSLQKLAMSFEHPGSISALAISRDGSTLAVSYSDRFHRQACQLWDLKSRRELFRLGGEQWVELLALSPDGQILAEANKTGLRLRIWNLQDQCLQFEVFSRRGRISSGAFSRDGQILALAYDDGTITQRLLATGTEIDLYVPQAYKSTPLPRAMAFDRTGVKLSVYFGGRYYLHEVLDTSTGEVLHTFHPTEGLVSNRSTYTVFSDSDLISTPTAVLELPSAGASKDESDELVPQLELSDEWLRYRGYDILWLPIEYRGNCSAMYGDTVVLGQKSGAVSTFRIDARRTQDLIAEWNATSSWRASAQNVDSEWSDSE